LITPKQKRHIQGSAAEVPELMKFAMGGGAAPWADTFAAAFAVADENQEMADQKTWFCLSNSRGNPDVEKAKVEFERAQKVEEQFHKDFDGVDFTWSIARRAAAGHFCRLRPKPPKPNAPEWPHTRFDRTAAGSGAKFKFRPDLAGEWFPFS
jgi:hypothetical protein